MSGALQQHALRRKDEYRALLAGIDLRGRIVVEIGVGAGDLTELILERGPEKVIGYEIDPSICHLTSPKLELHIDDFRNADLSAVDARYCLIANPPYDLLDDIHPLAVGADSQFRDVIIMIPERKRYRFTGFDIAFVLDENAFEPPTKPGRHLVIRRGF